ncbi:MAG: hypothetical protein ACI4T7_00985, partial [Alloprevotella sp.]
RSKLLIYITKFVTHVRKFVTNFFCADSKKKLAERENFQQGNKKLLGDNQSGNVGEWGRGVWNLWDWATKPVNGQPYSGK